MVILRSSSNSEGGPPDYGYRALTELNNSASRTDISTKKEEAEDEETRWWKVG